jgi:hypothetical protein
MAASIDNETRIALFKTIGLNEQKARETLKNHDVTRLLETTINEVRKFFSVFFFISFFSNLNSGEKILFKWKSNSKINWKSFICTFNKE